MRWWRPRSRPEPLVAPGAPDGSRSEAPAERQVAAPEDVSGLTSARIERDSAREPERDARTGRSAAQARIHHQSRWVDEQITQAMRRGEFDDLPGAGKPIADLGSPHDRDWWLKKLIEREQITGVLPAALQLRKDDAELDAVLDRESAEKVVRGILEDFNRRIVEARRQLQGGPPVVTPLRDVEQQVAAWRERRRR